MDKIEKSRIENNSLKEEIEQILELCDDAKAANKDSSFFDIPIDEVEMSSWEQETGITIPESYKEWLRFSGNSSISGVSADFWGPKHFHSQYVPDEFVVIGEMIGDGEVVCFSKETKHFIEYFENEIQAEYEDFNGVLNEVIRLLMEKLGKPQKMDQEMMDQMLKKIKELREKRNKQ